MEEVQLRKTSEVIIQIENELEQIYDYDPEKYQFELPLSKLTTLRNDGNDTETSSDTIETSSNTDTRPSDTSTSSDPSSPSNTSSDGDTLILDNVLKAPDFKNELQEVSQLHENGEKYRSLNQEMLNSIRENAQFSVPSIRFKGQEHTWELNSLVQKGKTKRNEDFHSGIVYATSLFIVTIPNLLWGDTFSLYNGIKSIFKSLYKIPRQIIGFPDKKTFEPRISKDQYRIDELLKLILHNVNSYQNVGYNVGFADDKVKLTKTTTKPTNTLELDSFITIDNVTIQIRNFQEIIERLRDVYLKFKDQWKNDTITRRQRLRTFLESTFTDDLKELAQEIVNEEEKERQEAIYQLIHDTFIVSEAERICSLMNSIGLIRETLYNDNKKKLNTCLIYQNQLKLDHPILSCIPEWVERKCKCYSETYDKQNPISNVLNSISKTLKGQEQYLFIKNIEIQQDVESSYKKLETKSPKHSFLWKFRIWRPSNWIVNQIQTKKSDGTLGYVTYECFKYKTYETSSWYLGWRFMNLGMRFAYYLNNGLFGLISNMIYGPLGCRSLVGIEEFQPDRKIDYNTGELVSTGSKYSTWFGRIASLWSNISESRDEFENAPDEGFFGKGFVRPFNLFWNYICKGAIGTTVAFIVHPSLSILNISVCLLLTLISPVWSLIGAVTVYLCNVFIYDIAPYSYFAPLVKYIFWDFLIKGICQTVITPVLDLGAITFGSIVYVFYALRYLGRLMWDSLMFYTFIKFKGRVPYRDGFIARRIKGPGLSMEYYQQISPELCVLMVQCELEREELSMYEVYQKSVIEEPLKNLQGYYNQFNTIGLEPTSSNAHIKKFRDTREVLTKKLHNVIENHKKTWLVKTYNNQRCSSTSRVKLSKDDLEVTLKMITQICTNFHNSLKSRLHYDNEYWKTKNINENDYSKLAIWYLQRVFNQSIMQPLEDTDSAGFKLKVSHINLKSYCNMIWNPNELRDDLEHVTVSMSSPMVPSPPAVPEEELKYPCSSDIYVVSPENMSQITYNYEKYAYLEKTVPIVENVRNESQINF
jgi:hypothetical protein